MAPPHVPNDPRFTAAGSARGSLEDDPNNSFRLLKFKKPDRDKFAESREKLRTGLTEDTELEATTGQLPENAHSQWLDLVVGLLTACKRASQKMKKRIGLQTYKMAAAGRGRNKLKTLGSIVDTTTEAIETSGTHLGDKREAG